MKQEQKFYCCKDMKIFFFTRRIVNINGKKTLVQLRLQAFFSSRAFTQF